MNPYLVMKRLMDIVGSLVGIIIFSPFLLGAYLWIRLVSPVGPVFADIPPRVGLNRKSFRLFKFRSMIPNGHQYLLDHPDLYQKYINNNYKLNAEEDPRIIKGGIFMRKYSIDELPQFFNILFGSMSLVGPRAYYYFEVEEQSKRYPEVIPYIEAALKVKPGLTGLWQVSGRSNVSFVDRVRLDAEYAKNASLLYDLKIILKTPYVVLSKKGSV